MALNKINIPISLAQGVDTKLDDKQEAIGSLRVLENATFDSIRKLKKRNGYDNISLKTTADVDIESGKRLATFENELTLFNNSNMYARIESLDKFSDKGAAFTAIPDSMQIIRNNKQQSNIDCASSENLNLYVYEDSDGIHLSIVDSVSNSFVVSKTTLSASGIKPKVVIRDNQAFCFYIDSTSLKYRTFRIFDFNNIEAEATLVSTLNATEQNYDVDVVGGRVTAGFNTSTAGGTLGFRSIKADDTLTAIVEVASEEPFNCINVVGDASSRIICTYSDNVDAKIVIFSANFGVKILAETSLETIASVTNISSVESTTDNYTVVYEVSAAASQDHRIRKQTIDIAGSAGTASALHRSLGLASKFFAHGTSYYFATIHDNTLQSTYFISDSDGNLISKISPNVGGNAIAGGSLPSVDTISSDRYLFCSQVKGRLVEDNGTFFSLLGVNSTKLDFSPVSQYQNTTLARNMHIAGGYLKMYDGNTIVEHGFHTFPEGIADGGTTTTGGFMSDGTREFKAVYAWTDAKGIIHRSAPSEGISITLSAGGSVQTQTITIPTLRLTDKENVIIELYQTEIAGTVFYKTSSVSAPTFNDKTADTIDITVGTSDADLIDNEALYTTGGVLDNTAATSSSIIGEFKNRVFVATPESEKLSYSKIVLEGFPVEFNDSLEIPISRVGGKIVAYIEMDDKLIIFKDRAIYYLSGDGPNNLGQQDTFIEPELIVSNIGCKSAESVVLTPQGVSFQSDKGIYLLTRGMDLQYVGAAVEAFNNSRVTSALMLPTQDEVRFTTDDNNTLMYDYLVNQWSTFANHKAESAVILGNDYYYLRPDGLLYKQNSNYSDNGSTIKMALETGWMAFGDAQAFQRIYRMLILGTFKSPHKLRIQVAYDYIDAFVQETTIDVSDFATDVKYGESTPYGAEAFYGGAGNPYQIRVDFKKQKCTAIKIRIEDIPTEEGEAFDISHLLFVGGQKAGEFKLPEKQQYGTS